MKIDFLKLPDFRNLKGFEIDFDERVSTTVLLGRNGSGKSNFIEAVVEIFRDLENGKISDFPYQVRYLCHGHRVEIINDPGEKKRQQFCLDGVWVSRKEFEAIHDEVLPKHIFAYYSGWNRRLEAGFNEPTRDLYKQWLNNEDRKIPLRRLFYCRKEYSQLVLLAFFLSGGDEVKKVLREYLHIESFESSLFTLKIPWWRGSGKPTKVQLAEGDSRFWYARGAFKHFLDDLWQKAFAPIYNEEIVERDIRGRKESTERLYLFIKDLAALKDLAGNNNPKAFFGLLESLFLCDLMDEVQVTVRHRTAGCIRFDQLSEGEQQLLTVLGLMIFTEQDESLFLLDEPDTHLNPSWIYDFYSLLEANFPKADSQLLVVTHNPLMIGSLQKNQVRLISQGQDAEGNPRSTAYEPEDDPIGMGVDGLLQSEIYGLRSTLAPKVLHKIDLRNRLLAMDQRSANLEQELRKLSAELGELGIAQSHPHPYYDRFAKALARNPLFRKSSLSPDESKEIDELTDELLDEILNEGKGV